MKVVSVDGKMPGLYFQKGAILNGEYYSSSGPEIYDWKVENNQLCAQLRVCSQAGGIPVYPRFSQPDNSESWDDAGNGI